MSVPTCKLTLEIPLNYIPEMILIFRSEERHHLGHFRGFVASGMAELLEKVMSNTVNMIEPEPNGAEKH